MCFDNKNLSFVLIILTAFTYLSAAGQTTSHLHIVSTGDVHGSWFDQPYVDGQDTKPSLMSVKYYVDSLRNAVGEENVLLLDAGDNLQGDNATYYFNRIADQDAPHLFPRICKYMGYDAVVLGNHDLEPGHILFDRVHKEMESNGIPWLGGNVIDKADGSSYFQLYKSFVKAGVKVTVFGFENPNMEAWIPDDLISGMDFLSLVPYAQSFVDFVCTYEEPDVVVVVAHSGAGDGDGSQYESQCMDLFKSLKGVDVLIGGHDHQNNLQQKPGMVYINSGAHAGYVGHTVIDIQKKGRKLISKHLSAELCKMDKDKVDKQMGVVFREDYELIREFTNREVGALSVPLESKASYTGMSDYVNLIHTVMLNCTDAKVSFAAPLSFDGRVDAGTIVFNDMFTIYPYENTLYVVNMKGSEIKKYLEASYDNWIQTPGEHLLVIQNDGDDRTGTTDWSFTNRFFNFDSAAGLVYTVDVTKPYGDRVEIKSFADGSPVEDEQLYPVALSSYRASGGSGLLAAAGLTDEIVDERTVTILPEIRDLIYSFISENPVVDRSLFSKESVIGSWSFVPEDIVKPLMAKDMSLLFGLCE